MSAWRITRPQGPGSGGMWGAYPAPDVKAFPGARRTAGGHRPKKAAAAPSRYDRDRALLRTPEIARARNQTLSWAALTALENRTNLLKNPPKGGIPARLRRRIVMENARKGIRRLRPLHDSTSSVIPRDSTPATTRNAPPFIAAWVSTWSMPPTRPAIAASRAIPCCAGVREGSETLRARAPTARAMRMYPAWAMLEYI